MTRSNENEMYHIQMSTFNLYFLTRVNNFRIQAVTHSETLLIYTVHYQFTFDK